MRPNKFEAELRGHVAFYIGEGSQKLREGSIRWLAREQRLKDFLFVLAHKASFKMQPMLKEALCIATSARKRKHEESVLEKELYGKHGRGKRTKVDMNNKFAEHVLDRCPAAEDRSGVADEPSDDEDPDCEDPDCVDQDEEDQDEEEGEETSQTRTNAGVHTEEDFEMNPELGLTRGNEDTVASITEQFFAQTLVYRTRSKIDLIPILQACRNLDFYMVKVLLVNYLLDRLAEPSAKDVAWPLTSEMKEPDEIFDTMIMVEKKSDDNRIHEAFLRMNLFAAVNDKTIETTVSARIKTLEKHATGKAGTVAKELRGRLIDKYKAGYHMGRKWLDVAKWFGGTGIVLVFIVAGISEYAVSSGWLDIQRQFLQYVAEYLPSIKGLVQSLAEDGLKEYCRNGCLPEDRIQKLGAVEACIPQKDATVESDNENE